jgi:hypothetical protein
MKRIQDSCNLWTVQSPNFLTFKAPKSRFQGMFSESLCSLAGRYDNPIPTLFLVPIDCLKIPAPLTDDPLGTAVEKSPLVGTADLTYNDSRPLDCFHEELCMTVVPPVSEPEFLNF